MKTKLFFDCEFTGLYQDTSLISIGFIAENGDTFYAELTDYNSVDLDEWIVDNVIANMIFSGKRHGHFFEQSTITGVSQMRGYQDDLKLHLGLWLERLGDVEIWSDCLAYDWVLFNNIFGGAMDIPKNVYYIPFDICTQFKLAGIDPDINREEYAGMTEGSQKHNALWDAKVIKACHDKMSAIKKA